MEKGDMPADTRVVHKTLPACSSICCHIPQMVYKLKTMLVVESLNVHPSLGSQDLRTYTLIHVPACMRLASGMSCLCWYVPSVVPGTVIATAAATATMVVDTTVMITNTTS